MALLLLYKLTRKLDRNENDWGVKVSCWTHDGGFKVANPDKCHLLFNNKDRKYPMKVGNETIVNTKCEKLLDIKNDKERTEL